MEFGSLPNDVLGKVFDLLCLEDSVRFASTCVSARRAFEDRDIVANFSRGTPRSVERFLVRRGDRVKKLKCSGRAATVALSHSVHNFRNVVHLHLSAAQIPDGIAEALSGLSSLKTLLLRKLVPEHRSRKSGLAVFRTSWLDGPRNLLHVSLYFSGSYDEITFDHDAEFETLLLDSSSDVEVEGTPPPPSSSLSVRAREISTRRGTLALSPFTKLRSTAHARRNPLIDFDERSLPSVKSLVYACSKHPWVPELPKMNGLERLTVEADSTLFRMREFEGLSKLRHLNVRTKGGVYLVEPGNFGGFEKGRTFVNARSSRNVDISDEFYAPLDFP